MKLNSLFILLFALIFVACGTKTDSQDIKKVPAVKTGADLLLSENYDLIKNKNIAIVTNHTAVLSNGTHIVDTLFARKDLNIVALFGPEHGIRGDAPDGMKIEDGKDYKTGLPVFSLYGKIRKPTKEMLKDVDVLIFDIQDIGARFYTFISTMYNIIESAAENNIPLIILDRPNPINGVYIDGPLREEEFKSFVAIAPIPVVHGMTVGELANIFNEEKMITSENKANITVIKMKNWERSYFYDECGLDFVKPSPNIPNLDAAIIYPGICLLEGTNISEGRGTYSPFLQIGAPYIKSDELIAKLNSYGISGVKVSPISYTPNAIPNMSMYPKYKDEECHGIKIEITDRNKLNSLKFGVKLVAAIHALYPDYFEYRRNWLDKLYGSEALKNMINDGKSPNEIFESWKTDLSEFSKLRKKYLLY